jgi:hypothetical protein
MNFLRKWWRYILLIVLRPPAPPASPAVREAKPTPPPVEHALHRPTHVDRPRPEPQPEPAQIEETPLEAVRFVSPNRAERRRLERRRRKHDKFVTPQGPQPAPKPSSPPTPRPKPLPRVEIITEDDGKDAELFLADKHHEDTQDVLYREAELYGEFNFRDTILQQLDRYFVYLKRMQKKDPQSYGFYKQVGATILPYVNTMAYDRKGTSLDDDKPKHKLIPLAPWFHKRRPAFGCFVYGADPETEKWELESRSHSKKGYEAWVPKFMHFTKYSAPPPEVQMMAGGDIYKMTIWWDRPQDPKIKRKYGAPEEFAIFISADGKEIVALRTCETRYVPTPSRFSRPKGRRKGGRNPELWLKRELGAHHIPERAYRIPSHYEKWAKEDGTDAQTLLTGLFLDAVQRHELSLYSMIRVAATKDAMTAVFSVNIRRMGYFFQDRDIALNESGTRRKVFHMVRAYQRKDGSVIKFHFRGEKSFTWAGYQVSITVPGRDHADYASLDIGMHDEYWWDGNEEMVGLPEMGKIIADNIASGKGAYKR